MTKESVYKKSKKLKLSKFLPLAVALVFLVGAFFVSLSLKNYFSAQEKTAFDKIITAKDYRGYESFTKEKGLLKSYGLLKARFAKNEPQAHDFAHVIGIVSHNQKGLSGLSFCDTAFNYGCMHGFMEAYLTLVDLKEGILEIEKTCRDMGNINAPSCLHGIGHGVLMQASYNLDRALSNCQILGQISQSYCFDGVFMERLAGSMLPAKNKIIPRGETLDEPCRDISHMYKAMCWRNQVTLWLGFYRGSTIAAGQKCLGIEKEFQSLCFETVGLGIAMTPDVDRNQAASMCSFMDGNQLSDDCVIGVMKELLFEGKNLETAATLCQIASPNNQANCLTLYNQLLGETKSRFKSP